MFEGMQEFTLTVRHNGQEYKQGLLMTDELLADIRPALGKDRKGKLTGEFVLDSDNPAAIYMGLERLSMLVRKARHHIYEQIEGSTKTN